MTEDKKDKTAPQTEPEMEAESAPVDGDGEIPIEGPEETTDPVKDPCKTEEAAPETEEGSPEVEPEEAPQTEAPEKEAPAEDTPKGGSGESKAGKEKDGGFFGRGRKDKELKALQEAKEALEDRVKRQMAEFENFRRRTDKEKESMFSMGERSMAEKILPVMDNLERGLASIPEDQRETPVAQGMEKTYRQFLDTLASVGITPIEALGQPFDPNLHNAVMQVDSEEYESGVVAQELQKGYMYRDTVLRYSMVGVVK